MELFKDFVSNTALLLSMSLIGNVIYLNPNKKPLFSRVIHGIFIGIIGIVLMLNAITLSPGLIFDTRSILVSVTGLFYGLIPTAVAVIIISIYRIIFGGFGMFTGLLVTLLTASVGLLWRKYRLEKLKRKTKFKWIEYYFFGMISHIIMILCMFSLPDNSAIETIKKIIGPVLLIYPVGVLLLCGVTKYFQNYIQTKAKLVESETRFGTIFDQAPIGIAVANKHEIFFINPKLEDILGRIKDEIKNIGWHDLTHPDDLVEDENQFSKLISGEISSYTMKKRYIKPDGSIIWALVIIASLHSDSPNEGNHICMIQDITDLVNTEQDLHDSETKYKNLYLDYLNRQNLLVSMLNSIPDLIFYKDKNSVYMGCNKAFSEFVGKDSNEIVGLTDFDLVSNDLASSFRVMDQTMMRMNKARINEEEVTYPDGKKVILETLKTPYYDSDGNVLGLIGISRNITERKQKEEEIIYLTNHDSLTGLYNRFYFEKALSEIDNSVNFPYSVIVGDINNLRLVNDVFGHEQGDKLLKETALLLKECCRSIDIIARMGGDEFSIILPETDNTNAKIIYDRIIKTYSERSLVKDNAIHLSSISMGFVTKTSNEEEIGLLIKLAEEHMNRRKLLTGNTLHGSLMSTIKTTVFEKSHETEAHAERMVFLSRKVGEKMGLSQDELVDLELATTMHDLGKIGIAENIITKPGKLSEDEWVEIKKHPEIGFRIAQTIPELKAIAQYILCHHERWDGKGYPHSLKGDDIPLIARIISIVDSYDAMTDVRPYKKSLTKEEAITEIRLNSGTQFDPRIAKIFIDCITNEKKKL